VRRWAPPVMSSPVHVTFDLVDPPSSDAASKPFSAKRLRPTKELQRGPGAIAEDKDGSSHGVLAEPLSAQGGQPLDPAGEVCWLTGQ
jgi:hypothetical protein